MWGKTKGLDYHGCYRVGGFKAYQNNGTLSFVSFLDTLFRIEAVQEEVLVRRPVEDEVELVDIKGAKGKADGIKFNLVVYALAAFETEAVNNSTVLKTVQEIAVIDEEGNTTIISLNSEACGLMKVNQSYLLENASAYRGEIKVWPSAMAIPAPEGMRFDLSGIDLSLP